MPVKQCSYIKCDDEAMVWDPIQCIEEGKYWNDRTKQYYCSEHANWDLKDREGKEKVNCDKVGYTPEVSVRQEILETALELTTGDRNKTYGPPKPNLTCFANLVQAYLNGMTQPEQLDATDGAIIMALAKISRIAANKQHKDNYIDGTAYMAIAGECAE